ELGELEDAPELELEPPKGLLGRALAQRAARERVEAEARKRSALLDHAARQRVPEHAPGTNGTHQPQRMSILDTRAPDTATITRLRPTTAGRREGRMAMETREQRVQRDDAGREVQRTMGRTGKARSAEDQLIELWEGAKVDKSIWTTFAAAYAKSGLEPAEAADEADALYMELIRRENLATTRR
ncbi:MAG TPA: hypothetical protein VJN18_11275, partial [Polyangiaceae bacterium]|nr:hypothetical protein [Polyangiaceae bacterium]